MPRLGQIIPEYLHPHVQTYINDNTVFQDTAAPAPDGVRFIYVFTSGKGRDNVVLPFELENDYLEEYGNPNYRLFGQPGYMPWATLKSRLAKCWCMRIMPEDAAYANVVILAKVKVDSTVPENKKLVIKHEAIFHTALTAKDEFSSLTDLMIDETVDADGFKTFPLFGTFAMGRGIYGNSLRIRVTGSPQADKDNQYKNYTLEVLVSEGGISRKEYFPGTLFPEALDGNNTLYLPDIMNDSEEGSTKMNLYVSEASLEKIFNIYKTDVDPTTTLTLETFDPVTGKDKAGAALPKIKIDTTLTDAVALDVAEGITLSGGTDGAFAYDPATLATREAAIDAAYTKAFAGQLDPVILSKRRTPADVILDANFSDEVKRDLITLITKRYDAKGYIDSGIINTQSDAIAWAESMANLGDRIYSKNLQYYMIRDPFSGKNIPMTITYFFAEQLPYHIKNNGNHIPFTGETYTKLAGAIKNSLKPVIDADDLEIKEKLYNLRVNYFECIAENTFIRGTQSTSQNIWSDLSEENNMMVLLEIKRKIETMVAASTYNFVEKEDRRKFTEAAERMLEDYIGTKVRAASVFFDMNAWEEERSILHCYLGVTYRTLAKRNIVEIDINKRV